MGNINSEIVPTLYHKTESDSQVKAFGNLTFKNVN